MRIPIAFATAAMLCAHAEAPAGDAVRGKALFTHDMCYTCHGTAGQGGDRGSGPRIAPNVFPWEGFVQQVRHPREQMPRYSAKFVDERDLADIYAYLVSQPATSKSLPALLK
ncbi:MAG TPA: cytochrome c [Usitatibacter sp.]|jgi:mono/diheme cytochrome c family protein|nr:cytochrome c [Usitatibacter sp.]